MAGSKLRSKRYRAAASRIEPERAYPVAEAAEALKAGSTAKFDETVDLVIKLDIDARQADQLVRGTFSLPHGTGKSLRVIAFADGAEAQAAKDAGAIEVGGEDLAKKIQDGWMDFDVAVAHPSAMRFVGRLGKLLGPQGKMPSPKSGTVTPQVGVAVREFMAGKIEYRNDAYGNVHVAVGKISFDAAKLTENIEAIIEHIQAVRPSGVKGVYFQKATLSTTMGPGLRLSV